MSQEEHIGNAQPQQPQQSDLKEKIIQEMIEIARQDPVQNKLALGKYEEAFKEFCRKNLDEDLKLYSSENIKLSMIAYYVLHAEKDTIEKLKSYGISERNAKMLKNSLKSKNNLIF